jgi:hypothetical protein
MPRRARLLLSLACALIGFAGVARADPTAELASSPAQRCLFPAVDDRVKPEYPSTLYKLKLGGTVGAEFEFEAPDKAPSVHFDGEPRPEWARSIEKYASQLRVPCMTAADKPVRLRQSFAFVPNDGRKVAWTTPVDVANAARSEMLKCIVRPSTDLISYPGVMERLRVDADVIARLRFFDPKAAPTVQVLSDGGDPAFEGAISDYVQALRVPCLVGGPIDVNFSFQFRVEGGGRPLRRHTLKDLSLVTFLGSVKPVAPGSAFFDTTDMKCPFDVRLTFRQPFELNRIDELDDDVPARHPLLDWLGERELNVDKKLAGELLYQQMTIHIPCLKIDL